MKHKAESINIGRFMGRPGEVIVNAPGRDDSPEPEPIRRDRFIKGAKMMKPGAAGLTPLVRMRDELLTLETELATKTQDHITPAAQAAGYALFKVLGRECFASADEAVVWARKHLPLSKAWADTAADAGNRGKLERKRQDLRRTFWADAEALALKLQKQSPLDGGRAIDEVMSVTEYIQ